MAWNMVVDPDAAGVREPVSQEQLWERFGRFLDDVIPVADGCGNDIQRSGYGHPIGFIYRRVRRHFGQLLSEVHPDWK